jgi:hypothetical protein
MQGDEYAEMLQLLNEYNPDLRRRHSRQSWRTDRRSTDDIAGTRNRERKNGRQSITAMTHGLLGPDVPENAYISDRDPDTVEHTLRNVHTGARPIATQQRNSQQYGADRERTIELHQRSRWLLKGRGNTCSLCIYTVGRFLNFYIPLTHARSSSDQTRARNRRQRYNRPFLWETEIPLSTVPPESARAF